MDEVTSKVGLVSDVTKSTIKALSAYGLPVNPSGRGMSAADIKNAFYKPIIEGSSNIIDEINRIVDEINSIIGNMDALATEADSLVGAINENKGKIDANGDLINQANTNIGDIKELATEAESLVGAINELLQKWNVLEQASEGMAADIGNVEELLTEAKTLVGAINENKEQIDENKEQVDQNATAIGNVTEVTIGSKGNLVDSINSLKYYHDVLQGDVRGILARLAAAAHNYVLRDFLEFVSYCKDEHDELSPGDLYTGDNVLIVEENVPDFWFEETSDESLVETYTYEGVEYPLAARHGNGELMGVFHILESDYTVIEGYSSIASENAEAAVQAKKAAEESANAAEASASAAEEAEEAAEASEEAAEKYSREAKEAWNEVKEYKSHFANALVGHARGNPVVISDLSPHSHTVECVAERKNLFPNFITDQTYTNGSFVKVNEDGSITIHKVAGDIINETIELPLKAGVYNLSNGYGANRDVWIQVTDMAVSTYYGTTISYGVATITLPKDDTCKITLYTNRAYEADSITFYPQLEKGTVATPYTPYLESVEGLEVKVYGKNLLSDAVYDANNWVRDEGISINSTNSKVYYLDEIPNGTYTISAKAKSNYVYLYFFYSVDNGATWQGYRGANGTYYIIAGTNAYNIAFEKTENTRFLLWHNNINFMQDVDYIQIEAGATATAYEPYKAPVIYTTDADGRAELISVTDTMTVISDAGALLDVTYQRDINALNTALDLNAVDERISAVNAENDAKLAEIRQGIGRIDARMSRAERFLGIDEAGFLVIDVTGETVSLPQNAHRYAQLLELHGDYTKYTIDDESSELYHHEELFLNYPQKLVGDNGTVLLEITDEMAKGLPDFGLVEGNYIYFLDGRAIYHREYALGEYYANTPPVEGAEWVEGIAYNDYGLWILPQATETDVTHVLNFDGVLDIEGINSIQIFMKHSEEEIDAMNGPGEEYSWSIGKTKFAFELL